MSTTTLANVQQYEYKEIMLISKGHRRLQEAFAEGLIQAREAAALEIHRQALNDILHERRTATVVQTVKFRRRYRIPVSAWTEPAA